MKVLLERNYRQIRNLQVGGDNSEQKPVTKNRTEPPLNADEAEDEVPDDDEDVIELNDVENTPKKSEVHQASEANSEQKEDTDNEHYQNPPLKVMPNTKPNSKPNTESNSPLKPKARPANLHNREGSEESDGIDTAADDTNAGSTETHASKKLHAPTESEAGRETIRPDKSIKHKPILAKPADPISPRPPSPMPKKRTTKTAPKPSLLIEEQPSQILLTPKMVPIPRQNPSSRNKDSSNQEMPRISVTIRRLTPEELDYYSHMICEICAENKYCILGKNSI